MREDTLLSRVHGRTLRFVKAFDPSLIAMVILVMVATSGVVILVMPDDTDRAARKTCDRAVELLLTSRDPIELQRSGILIHELNCGISRRLPNVP